MDKWYVLLVFFLLTTICFGQCPTGSVTLNSQADIDNFALDFPDCSFINGSVTISGPDITDLSGISGIASIGEQLLIQNCNALTTLATWDEVALLGSNAKLTIQHNDLLVDLTTFFGVLNQGLVLNNLQALNDLSGLNGISSVNRLELVNCDALTDLSGLENTAISDQLIIESNLLLEDVSDLNSVIGPLQTLKIELNPELVSFNGLAGLNMLPTGSAFLLANNSITNFNGFTSWTTAPAVLAIADNPDLNSLSGLAGINGPVTRLDLQNNNTLTNYNGLQGITKVTELTIDNNSGLLSLEGLNGLINTAAEPCEIIINGNSALTNIAGLNGITPNAVTFLEIDTNANLAICNQTLICGVLELGSAAVSIIGNASGCASIAEVEDSCGLSVFDQPKRARLVVFPNPVTTRLNIDLRGGLQLDSVVIYNLAGKALITQYSTAVSLSSLVAGMYFVKVNTDQGAVYRTIIKE